jgi:hypothetical protein
MNKEVYKTILDELCECPLFRGQYDAKNGSARYMCGIWTVMEFLAGKVSDEEQDKFNIMFATNMRMSEEIVRK